MKATKARTRIWLSGILAAAMTPAVVLVVILHANLAHLAARQLQHDVEQLAKLASIGQTQTVESAQQMLYALAVQPQIRNADSSYADRIFGQILRRYPEYANIGLIDPRGRLIASGRPPIGTINLADRSYFQEALASKGPSVGEYLVGRVSGKASIILARPVFGSGGRVDSVIYAAVDLGWLNRRADAGISLLPSGSSFLMTDRHGTILADPGDQSMVGRPLPRELDALLQNGGEEVLKVRASNGVRDIYAALSLESPVVPNRQLHVILGIRSALLFRVARRLLLVPLIALAAAFVFGIVLIWAGVGLLIVTPARSMVEAAERRYRRLVEDARDGFLEIDSESRVRFLNPSMAEMLGYSRDELLGKQVEAIIDPGELDDHRHQMELRREGKPGRYLRRLRRRDGAAVWTIVSGSPFTDERGRFIGSFGTFTDVTERTEIELRLRESEERFRTFIQEAPEAFFVTDEEGRLIEFNPAAERLTGIDREWAIGRGAWELQERLLTPERRTPERVEAMRALLLESLATGEGPLLHRELEGVLTLPDGTRRNFQQRVFPIRTSKGYRLGGAAVDTTRRVSTEQQLRQSLEQLMEAQKMEAVGRLAGGVAHDFNNMLTAILGFGSILSAKLESDPLLHGYIDNVVTTAHRAADLTQSLLTFGRRRKGEVVEIDLVEATRRHSEFLPSLLGDEIELDLQLYGPVSVSIDPSDFDQILVNLITNARDALPEGGSVVVGLRSETILSDSPLPQLRPGRYAHLWVRDEGSGMEESVRLRAFEPFFTTKDTGKGTGLGLAIVWSIVEQRNGAVGIESRLGRGTTVHVYLPVVEQSSVTTRPEGGYSAEGHATILVAEDDRAVREFISSILRGYGYTVLTAPDGVETLEQVRRNGAALSLILLDVVMPRKSGPEVRRELRSVAPDLPVLYMSGYTTEVLVEQGVGGPDDHVILKPFTAAEITEAVRRVLDSRTR